MLNSHVEMLVPPMGGSLSACFRLQKYWPSSLRSTPGKFHNVRLSFELFSKRLIVDCEPLDMGDCKLDLVAQCRIFYPESLVRIAGPR